MTDVLLMSTSPRKGGNCDDALDTLTGALQSRGVGHSVMRLREFDIKRCTGCLGCQKGSTCPVNDEFADVWVQFKAAPAIVMIVPVYWCAPPGLMKDFIDRTVVDFSAGGVMASKQMHLVSVAQSAGFGPHEEMVDTWIRWLGGEALLTKMRLIAFHRGELAASSTAKDELETFAEALASGA